MKRREFVTLLGGAAGWPLATRAQQPAMPVVGFLSSGSPQPYAHVIGEFRQGLKEVGYVEGQNIAIEYRWAEEQYDRLPVLAAELVRRQVAVIAATGSPCAFAAKAATTTIPIVFEIGFDPVPVGLVASLHRPSGNLTGVTVDTGMEIWGKRLALLKETVPGVSRVGYLATRAVWEAPQGSAVREAARQLGISLFGTPLEEPLQEAEYRRVLASMSQDRLEALVVSELAESLSNLKVIVELAEKARLPAIYPWREAVELGGVMAYAEDLPDLYRHTARQIDEILKGVKPQDIPFYQPTKFELILNLKAAKALGLIFPSSLLGSADEVIE